MRFRQSLAVSLVAVALAGCPPRVTVTTDHDPGANFGALHTYAWRAGPQQGTGDPRIDSTLLDARVRGAVNRVLASKGYTQDTAGTRPDFLVGYHAVVRQKTSVQTINTWYGYGPGPGWGGMGGWPQTYVREYDEGTLLIDIIDPATMKLLWRGSGTAIVVPGLSPEEREKRINSAVDQILADFPPRSPG